MPGQSPGAPSQCDNSPWCLDSSKALKAAESCHARQSAVLFYFLLHRRRAAGTAVDARGPRRGCTSWSIPK